MAGGFTGSGVGMTQENVTLMRGFLRGMRVTQHAHDIESGGMPELHVLRDIAEGKLTLVAPADEVARRLPGMPDGVVDRMDVRRGSMQQTERVDAGAILSFLPPFD